MTVHIIKNSSDVMNYVDQVRSIADTNRSALGFLPHSAYSEAAMKECLWIAVHQKTQQLLGYLFFGGRYPHLKVFQVYVAPTYRSVGLARRLIDELREHGEKSNYLTITARVAAELKANRFWKNIGFYIVSQVPGVGSTRTLNIYMLELDVPSLFTSSDISGSSSIQNFGQLVQRSRPLLQTPSYVIDLNVFFDVVHNRGTGESQRIVSSAFSNEIKLAVTSEFVRELERCSDQFEKDPVLEFARTLPTLPELSSDTLTPLVEGIQQLLCHGTPKTGRRAVNDKSDFIHLASCIHHRAYGFVTRDAAILRHATEFYKEYDIRILSPTDLYEFDDAASAPTRVTVAIRQQEVSVSELNELERSEAERFLTGLGLEPHSVSSCLAPGTTHSRRLRLVVKSEKNIIAIGSWNHLRGIGQDNFAHLYVDEDHQNSDSAINHLLESLINLGNYGTLSQLNLIISSKQIKTREVAVSRGFHPVDNEGESISRYLSKLSFKGVVTTENWTSFRNEFLKTTDLKLPCEMARHNELINTGVFLKKNSSDRRLTIPLFDFETYLSPGTLICPDRTAVMIPIREEYANDLLAATARQIPLFPGKEATLRLERAYFSGSTRIHLLERGKIVVFYISSKRQEAVATARITFSSRLTKTQALLNLGRQGVLTEQDIDKRANSKGEITAVTFDNVIVFQNYISYHDLKRIGCVGGANLVTAQELSHESLCRIVAQAFE